MLEILFLIAVIGSIAVFLVPPAVELMSDVRQVWRDSKLPDCRCCREQYPVIWVDSDTDTPLCSRHRRQWRRIRSMEHEVLDP